MTISIVKEDDRFLVVLDGDIVIFSTLDYEEAREYVMRLHRSEI